METKASAPVLINGSWKPARSSGMFSAVNPANGTALPEAYPVSTWDDLDEALTAATAAFDKLQRIPSTQIADFLRRYAALLEERGDAICTQATEETGLPYAPRLREVELGRTCNQLRLAADAAESGAWRQPTIDTATNIRSVLEPIGPVVVFGPNNFPLAYNGISGGDFASAIAAGNPVIAKAHPCHPTTSRLLAECANEAARSAGLPAGTVQMVYAMDNQDGLRLVADRRTGATGFTGSRTGGLALKAAADAAGKPIYLEMSSINPVVILKGALAERGSEIAGELATSALMATGQFCTNPGLIIVEEGDLAEHFITKVSTLYAAAPCGTLLSEGVRTGLEEGTRSLVQAGAVLVTGGQRADREGFSWRNTLLRVDGACFLNSPASLQTEVFGNSTLVVVAKDLSQIKDILSTLEGNLTGCIYSARDGMDEGAYESVACMMRPLVGRLLNDKMPTGVAVCPAMNHGGPFPATGHPHFTAVGMPASLKRFTMLACYDNVRPERLPDILRD